MTIPERARPKASQPLTGGKSNERGSRAPAALDPKTAARVASVKFLERPTQAKGPEPEYLRLPVRHQKASRFRGGLWMLLVAPLFFTALFVSMRQDLQLHLMLKQKADLEARLETLRQDLRASQRDLAGRADFGKVWPNAEERGLRAPSRAQVVALIDEPPAPEEEPRPLTLAVLEALSGAGHAQAPRARSVGVEEQLSMDDAGGIEADEGQSAFDGDGAGDAGDRASLREDLSFAAHETAARGREIRRGEGTGR